MQAAAAGATVRALHFCLSFVSRSPQQQTLSLFGCWTHYPIHAVHVTHSRVPGISLLVNALLIACQQLQLVFPAM